MAVAWVAGGSTVIAYSLAVELWQMNPLVLSYPVVGLGLLTGSFSITLALLYLRIQRLTSLLKGKDQRIKSILSVDPLTGLINRTALCAAGDRLLQAQAESEISLITLNLDRFKVVSDAFGHEVADELLRQVGERIQMHTEPQDVLARTGDNEFSLLLSPGNEARTYEIADQILASVHHPFRVQTQLVRIQGRIGIAFASEVRTDRSRYTPSRMASDSNDLLFKANIALSQVRDTALCVDCQYAVFYPEMKDAIASRVSLQQSLSAALDQQQLQVRYQAIVDIKTGKAVGFEALVRWQHPELGLMRPDDFLPIAEELGLTFKIDRWVLDQVCRQLAVWRAEGLSPFISVNLAGSHLDRADLVEYIRSLLACHAIEPSQLSVEVTESVMIANLEQATETLVQLRHLGVGISLDDFGTGYCSFNYLQQFPVDALKVDRSFIRYLGQPTEDRPVEYAQSLETSPQQDELIVQAILSLASALKIRVVVEGVERLDQWQSLQKMGCGYVQGNYFSNAIEAECARALLKDK